MSKLDGIVPLLALQGTAPLERAHRWVVAPGAALALPSALEVVAPPRLWALLALNLGACQCCKLGFFRLLAATTSLSATLAQAWRGRTRLGKGYKRAPSRPGARRGRASASVLRIKGPRGVC